MVKNKQKSYLSGLSCLVALLLAGCGSGGGGVSSSSAVPSPSASVSSGVTLAELAAAPQQVTVGTQTLKLSAYLYRNFQPMVGTNDGSPLIGNFTVAATDGSALPANLSIVTAYVVQNGAIGTFTAVSPTTYSATTRLYDATGGPQWTPGSNAEAVVEVLDSSGNEHLLQAPAITIIGAD